MDTARTKVFNLRVTPKELADFSHAARSMGLTMSQLMRILMQADIAKCTDIDISTLDKQNTLIVRFVEEKSIVSLSRQIRRFGNLMNQATRALNDLRARKSMSANFVAEKLIPIWETVNSVYEHYQDFEEDWGRMKLFLLKQDVTVLEERKAR